MAGLGEVKVSLGLDTTAATQQLKKFFSQFGEPIQDPLKNVDKSLDSTVKKAKQLGFEWDNATKQFKSSQGFTQTQHQNRSALAPRDVDFFVSHQRLPSSSSPRLRGQAHHPPLVAPC